jgi:hypothetical protein
MMESMEFISVTLFGPCGSSSLHMMLLLQVLQLQPLLLTRPMHLPLLLLSVGLHL